MRYRKEEQRFDLKDAELAFTGPASPEVIDAWRSRLEGMKLLRDFCGPTMNQVQEDYLACLNHPDHTFTARVCCCIAVKAV